MVDMADMLRDMEITCVSKINFRGAWVFGEIDIDHLATNTPKSCVGVASLDLN